MAEGNSAENSTFFGSAAIFLGVLVALAGLVGAMIFFIGANSACPSFRDCNVSEEIVQRTRFTMAVYSIAGGLVSGVALGVLGEISQHLSALRKQFEDSED